ncbi:hypothetical protein CRUP_002658 [Coryphaenoides rupestris]|nr:hypothetical protein CRUP_002658 [Coryphaenoides rupestris]
MEERDGGGLLQTPGGGQVGRGGGGILGRGGRFRLPFPGGAEPPGGGVWCWNVLWGLGKGLMDGPTDRLLLSALWSSAGLGSLGFLAASAGSGEGVAVATVPATATMAAGSFFPSHWEILSRMLALGFSPVPGGGGGRFWFFWSLLFSPFSALSPPPLLLLLLVSLVMTRLKSYEFEDLLQCSSEGCRGVDWYAQSRLGLTRTLSEENVYEDILDPPLKENPYEDIELERTCLGSKCVSPAPSSPAPDTSTKVACKPAFFRQTSERRSFKLLELRKTARDGREAGLGSPSRVSPPSTPSSPDDTPCLSGDPYNRRRRKIPKARRGKKRMKKVSQSTESSSGRAHSQRLVSVQTMLRQTGRYRTLERDLMDLQERKLFEYFIVVALHKTKAGVPYLPEVTQQFPLKLERSFKFMRETEDQLKVIPQFCFPDAKDWAPIDNFPSETFSFVLTGEDGSRRFGYCRRLLPSGKGRRLPEVYCIVSRLGCFDLFSKRRVIFTADKLSTLSQCCHAVVALLYPFTWQHTYIPVLPPSMLDIVCTPTPFIVGLLSSSLPRLKELPIEEVLVVDLCNSRFLRQLDDEDSILPHKLQAALEHMVGHYSLFMGGAERDDESAVSSPSSPSPSPGSSFQREAFRKAVTSKSLRRFLEVFMETQTFAGFVQERELRKQGLRGLFEVRAQEYLDSLPGSEQRGVNKFLKGLGNKMKFLSKK